MQWNPTVWVSESRRFLLEVRSEYRKVTWPNQREAVAGTVGVLVVVAIISLVLAVIDFVLGQLIRLILP